jgi:hypothetical protein
LRSCHRRSGRSGLPRLRNNHTTFHRHRAGLEPAPSDCSEDKARWSGGSSRIARAGDGRVAPTSTGQPAPITCASPLKRRAITARRPSRRPCKEAPPRSPFSAAIERYHSFLNACAAHSNAQVRLCCPLLNPPNRGGAESSLRSLRLGSPS